jgi:hypothetical protein
LHMLCVLYGQKGLNTKIIETQSLTVLRLEKHRGHGVNDGTESKIGNCLLRRQLCFAPLPHSKTLRAESPVRPSNVNRKSAIARSPFLSRFHDAADRGYKQTPL